MGMTLSDSLPDLHFCGSTGRRWLPRLPDSGPTGDLELDLNVAALARVARVTHQAAIWGPEDCSSAIAPAQQALTDLLAARGDRHAELDSWSVFWAAYFSASDPALRNVFNALAAVQGRRKSTWWRWT
jgi:hypothetical protein